jgi:arylsulfatase A-like enzyme
MTGDDFAKNPDVRVGMDPRDLEHIVALYDGEIRYTDEHIGRLLDVLRGLGVYDDTVVVVTSDHGEEFFEHGAKGHAKTLYDEILRVPLVLQYPRRVPAGTVVQDQVRLMDVAPTVLGLAGVSSPDAFGTGLEVEQRERDLSPWLMGRRSMDTFPRLLGFSSSSLMGDQVSVRAPQAKLILYKNKKGARRREVFDIARDPSESHDLWPHGPLPAPARRLDVEVASWLADMSPSAAPSAQMELDQRQLDQLRALGYVE